MKLKYLLLLVGGMLLPTQVSMAQDATEETTEPAVETTEESSKKAKKAKNKAAKDKHKFENLTVDEVKAALEKGEVTVLDATGGDSYKKAHVPGALHFSVIKGEKFAESLPEDKAALIVAYCGGPQ